MDEKDFQRIGQLIAEIVDSRLAQMEERLDARFNGIEARFEQVDARFEQVDARFEQVDARLEQLAVGIEKLRNDFEHKLGLQGEAIEKKIQLLGEGQQMLLEKVERLESRVDRIETSQDRKIERLIVEFAAHVADSNAHRGVYRVKEDWIRFGVDGDTSRPAANEQGEPS